MRLHLAGALAEANEKVAQVIADRASRLSRFCLGAGICSASEPVYSLLSRCAGGLSSLRLVQLYEYVGAASNDLWSVRERLIGAMGGARLLPLALLIDPQSSNPIVEIDRHVGRVGGLGGLDLALLGLRENGEIGPGAPSRTRLQHARTVAVPLLSALCASPDAGDKPPSWAMTFSIDDLRQAKAIVLLVYGRGAGRALAQSLQNPTSPVYRLRSHSALTIILDHEAESELRQQQARCTIEPWLNPVEQRSPDQGWSSWKPLSLSAGASPFLGQALV